MENETPDPGTDANAEATGDDGAVPQYSPDELAEGQQADDGSRADVNLDLVLDIPVEVSLRVGSTDISIRDLVSLVEGSVVALDRDAGEPMDVLVNGTLIAHGEIVIVDDQYGVRLTDVVSPAERIEQLH
ncbi:MAG: flagellar motor switch protein FliN [Gammaproteobacteria bacterium]|nr:flagellar motor switch protein FliN [Gammaproteobacteria bacterium]